MKAIAFSIVMLFCVALLQAVSSPSQTANPSAQEPLRIDAVTGFIHLLSKPEVAYPKEALQQHIEGKVELELTVSPQGDVVSERAVWGPSALQQATMDAFKKVKYIPFRRDGEPSVALVQVIVAYEKDKATISTESEHAITLFQPPNEFSKYGGSMSASDAIEKAARAAAAKRGGSGDNGDFGLGTGAHGRQLGNLEVLSDTQGVDFGPYLQRVLHDVKINWYNAIPKSVQMKHGNLVIEFAITKDGKIGGMKLVASSGDVPLDRAAWAGIVGSNPFLPLPSEFGGQFIALRFRFFYNPTKEELAPAQQDGPPLPTETALRQCVRDVQAKRRQDLDSNQNIIAELEHDAASLTSSLGDGSLNKLDETVARYYRAEAVGKLNAMRAIAGQTIDVPAAQQALDDFDRVIATDADIPSWGVIVSNAEYMAGVIARNQVQSDSLEFAYISKCAEKGHAGCINIIASAHVTGRGGQQVDFIRALDLHNQVFDTGTRFRCAGALSARSIANIVYFTGARRPSDDELMWVQKSYSLSDQIELRDKEKGACKGAQGRIEEFLYRLSNGERRKDILSQATERLTDHSSVDRSVIEYLSGSIKENAFEAAVDTGKTVNIRCDGYFEGMWYAELMKKLPVAKKYYQRLSEIGQDRCETELAYAKKFKF